ILLEVALALPAAAQGVLGDDQLQECGAVLAQPGVTLQVLLDAGGLAAAQPEVEVNVDQLEQQSGVARLERRPVTFEVRLLWTFPGLLEALEDLFGLRGEFARQEHGLAHRWVSPSQCLSAW